MVIRDAAQYRWDERQEINGGRKNYFQSHSKRVLTRATKAFCGGISSRPALSLTRHIIRCHIQTFPDQNLALSTKAQRYRKEGTVHCSVATFRFNDPLTDFSRVTSMGGIGGSGEHTALDNCKKGSWYMVANKQRVCNRLEYVYAMQWEPYSARAPSDWPCSDQLAWNCQLAENPDRRLLFNNPLFSPFFILWLAGNTSF